MKPLSEDIKDVLITAAIVTAFGTDLFIGEFPNDAPDTAYLLRDTGGFDPRFMTEGQIDRPTVQLIVRGRDGYEANWTRVNEAITPIIAARHSTVNGSIYSGIWHMSDILYIGKDEKGRYTHSINFRADRKST